MAGVHKKPSDRARGKSGKWTGWYLDARGRRRFFAGTTDRGESLRLAQELEAQCRRERLGLDEPGTRERRAQAARPVAQHVEDYRLNLLAKGDTAGHADRTAAVLLRLLDDAAVTSVAEIAPDRVQAALGRLKVRRSARTCNHALGAVKSFARRLANSSRIAEMPRGLALIPRYPEESDRRRVRRALSVEELARLLAAAEAGPEVVTRRAGRGGRAVGTMTGPERALLYRLAMATGFRAGELRSLTPESFDLGDSPAVTIAARESKRGKRSGRADVQPIRRDVAAALRPLLEGKEPGRPVLAVPERTAEMLRADLERAGIPYRDGRGEVLDFHALRHSFITHLSDKGVRPKVLQLLARHSDVRLTLGRYAHAGDEDLREAIEGEGDG